METCIIGLTGSIGTGKSTVSTIFKQQGIAVVDADIGAREVVKPGTIGLKKIVKTFGKEILFSDGTLDRKKLGEIIFSDPFKRQKLDELLSDLIYKWIIAEKQRQIVEGQKMIVLDIPILFEGKYEKEVDKIIVVALTKQKQVEKIMKRDNITKKQANKKIKSQQSITSKILRADYVIDNNGTRENTEIQVLNWLNSIEASTPSF